MTNDCTLRIKRIMKEENMNATQFSESIGIQRAAMSHILNGRNNPSADVITKIVERFDSVNANWLLTGKGNMRIASDSAHSEGSIDAGRYPVGAGSASGDAKNTPASQVQKEEHPTVGWSHSLFDQPLPSTPTAAALASSPATHSSSSAAAVVSSPATHSSSSGVALVSSPPAAATPSSSPEAVLRTEMRLEDEIRKGNSVKSTEKFSGEAEKVVIYKERPIKSIDKILIFYSDNTFETFIAEKHETKAD